MLLLVVLLALLVMMCTKQYPHQSDATVRHLIVVAVVVAIGMWREVACSDSTHEEMELFLLFLLFLLCLLLLGIKIKFDAL